MLIDPIFRPAVWGFLGAFIYAGPRWATALVSARDAHRSMVYCTLDAVVALVVGAAASSAFGALILTATHVKDENAISAVIGLLANTWAPKIVAGGPGFIVNLMGGRLVKPLKEDDV